MREHFLLFDNEGNISRLIIIIMRDLSFIGLLFSLLRCSRPKKNIVQHFGRNY